MWTQDDYRDWYSSVTITLVIVMFVGTLVTVHVEAWNKFPHICNFNKQWKCSESFSQIVVTFKISNKNHGVFTDVWDHYFISQLLVFTSSWHAYHIDFTHTHECVHTPWCCRRKDFNMTSTIFSWIYRATFSKKKKVIRNCNMHLIHDKAGNSYLFKDYKHIQFIHDEPDNSAWTILHETPPYSFQVLS